MTSLRILRYTLTVATGVILTSCATVKVQQRPTAITVSPSAYDRQQAEHARRVMRHVMPTNTLGAPAERQTRLRPTHSNGASPPPPGPLESSRSEQGNRYPDDVQFHGGGVVQSAEEYLIYVNLASSASCHTIAACWGDPSGFLHDLGLSDFMHLVDQYVGVSSGDRYRVSAELINVSYTPSAGAGRPFTDTDIQTIVHAVVRARGLPTGYHSIFDVFLVPGQDECDTSAFDSCYSPDNPAAFVFCADHSSADFPDVGHVLYTVEPYQNVTGCSSRPNGPNGQLVDSTNNVLSHETFETISNPDGTAWWNEFDSGSFDEEIGDECSFLLITPQPPALPGPKSVVYFDASEVTLNGHPYLAQPEYSNGQHACSIPAGDSGL
jgi:hypothetical protein